MSLLTVLGSLPQSKGTTSRTDRGAAVQGGETFAGLLASFGAGPSSAMPVPSGALQFFGSEHAGQTIQAESVSEEVGASPFVPLSENADGDEATEDATSQVSQIYSSLLSSLGMGPESGTSRRHRPLDGPVGGGQSISPAPTEARASAHQAFSSGPQVSGAENRATGVSRQGSRILAASLGRVAVGLGGVEASRPLALLQAAGLLGEMPDTGSGQVEFGASSPAMSTLASLLDPEDMARLNGMLRSLQGASSDSRFQGIRGTNTLEEAVVSARQIANRLHLEGRSLAGSERGAVAGPGNSMVATTDASTSLGDISPRSESFASPTGQAVDRSLNGNGLDLPLGEGANALASDDVLPLLPTNDGAAPARRRRDGAGPDAAQEASLRTPAMPAVRDVIVHRVTSQAESLPSADPAVVASTPAPFADAPVQGAEVAQRMAEIARVSASIEETRGTRVNMDLPGLGEGASLDVLMRGTRVHARIVLPEGGTAERARMGLGDLRSTLAQHGLEAGLLRVDATAEAAGATLRAVTEGEALSFDGIRSFLGDATSRSGSVESQQQQQGESRQGSSHDQPREQRDPQERHSREQRQKWQFHLQQND